MPSMNASWVRSAESCSTMSSSSVRITCGVPDAWLPDREIAEGRHPVDGVHSRRAQERPTARVGPERHSDRPTRVRHGVAGHILNRNHDHRTDRDPRRCVPGLYPECELHRRTGSRRAEADWVAGPKQAEKLDYGSGQLPG